eukprot:TRINITY_DN11674_c0_g3_i3.p1 TRINITY_DN11674_c0_g3~~TRINITY_DN11674_c0_g3_i3.p1  ORF type:complete len:209 (+),score=48.35 TRINITY_DN11674_c0_g3_i3:169-795(+)
MQMKFKLKDETLYLAANIFDRFVERAKAERSDLPIVGLAAMLIAGKYEEIYPPHLKHFIACLDKDISNKEVHDMELRMLKELGFDVSVPSVLMFLARYRKFFKTDENRFTLAMYICEAQLLSATIARYEPSLIAISGLYLAEKAVNKDYELGELLEQLKYSKEEVRICAKEMQGNMLVKERIMLSNIRRKYGKFKDVVKAPLDSIIVN